MPAQKQYHLEQFFLELGRRLLLICLAIFQPCFSAQLVLGINRLDEFIKIRTNKDLTRTRCDRSLSDKILVRTLFSALCPIETRHYSYAVNYPF